MNAMRFHQSYAKTLLNGCPAQLLHELDGNRRKATRAMDRGSLVDQMLFGERNFHTVDAKDWRTKVAQQERDAAIERGQIPMLAKEADELETAAGLVRSELLMRGVDLAECITQRTYQWTGEDGVECEGTPDIVCPNGTTIDLKCGPQASPDSITKQAWDMCWDVQGAAYQEAVKGNGEHWIIRAGISAEPLLVTVCKLSPYFMEIGRQRLAHTRSIWANCLESNEWPEWPDTVIDPPNFAVSKWIEGGLSR